MPPTRARANATTRRSVTSRLLRCRRGAARQLADRSEQKSEAAPSLRRSRALRCTNRVDIDHSDEAEAVDPYLKTSVLGSDSTLRRVALCLLEEQEIGRT
eukprot:6196601-Pleurochrysis_carterae.AAC.2